MFWRKAKPLPVETFVRTDDPILLRALKEVDELYPDLPPIAPPGPHLCPGCVEWPADTRGSLALACETCEGVVVTKVEPEQAHYSPVHCPMCGARPEVRRFENTPWGSKRVTCLCHGQTLTMEFDLVGMALTKRNPIVEVIGALAKLPTKAPGGPG
jgi:hypothetical protein